jgi:hypothetical protein
LQVAVAHTLPVQAPVQHSSAEVQAVPAPLQTGAHAPASQVPVQQSEAAVQACPSSRQTAAQVPAWQVPEQQSAVVVHAPPPGWQAEGQAPPWQVPVQQGLVASQGVGAYTQVVDAQAPPWHVPAQQSAAVVQVPPGAWHAAVQVPFWQVPVQQGCEPSHAEGALTHVDPGGAAVPPPSEDDLQPWVKRIAAAMDVASATRRMRSLLRRRWRPARIEEPSMSQIPRSSDTPRVAVRAGGALHRGRVWPGVRPSTSPPGGGLPARPGSPM